MSKAREETGSRPKHPFLSRDFWYSACCLGYVLGIFAFAVFMFETRVEFILVYLSFTLILLVLRPNGFFDQKLGRRYYWFFSIPVVVLAAAAAVYFRTEYYSLLYERMGDYSMMDYFFGLVLMVLAIFFTGVVYGRILPIITLIALVYAYFGWVFPGFLYHKGLSITRIIVISATEFNAGDGVLGTLPQIGITWIAIFTIFAGIASGFGSLDYIIKVSYRIFRKFQYGIPQIAVITSMTFGMFSGSGAANVAGTGSFTIPLMKRYGVPPWIAGAIESVASSGGQVMPPVMGAAAFVMASYLGKYYWEIVIIGFIPAIIFYACVALAVYLYSLQFLGRGDAAVAEEVPPIQEEKARLSDGFPLIAAIGTLVLLMGLFWLDVMLAGFFMIAAYLVVWVICQAVRLQKKLDPGEGFGRNFLKGAVSGAETTAAITTMLACIGVIVAVLVQTGLAQKLSFAIVEIAGGNREVLILLVEGLCILFGMLATTVAAYILTVTLAAPVLLDMGIPLLVTHFSVFYFAMIGLITPPVAPCCAVASGIARAGFLHICWYSMKIGVALVLLPFVFFYHPDIILLSSKTIKEFFTAGLGMSAMILGLNLHYRGLTGIFRRIIYFAAGAMAVFLRPTGGYVGIALCGFFLVWELYRLRDKGSSSFFKP
jgi:TRAP transporter 4TM/12TM fusion protein